MPRGRTPHAPGFDVLVLSVANDVQRRYAERMLDLRARLGLDRSQSLPPQPKRGWRGITAQDVREFLMAYCACFLAVSLYIA